MISEISKMRHVYPSTHTSLNIHAVFSTKERRPLIKDSFQDEYVTILDAGGVPYDFEYLW